MFIAWTTVAAPATVAVTKIREEHWAKKD